MDTYHDRMPPVELGLPVRKRQLLAAERRWRPTVCTGNG